MSFSRIFRTSLILGSAQSLSLVATFIRTKAIAHVLGPVGVGLSGVLTVFNGNVSIVAAWGIGVSGVRSIASATKNQRIERESSVRHLGKQLAWAGLIAAVVLFYPACYATFNSGDYALEFLIGGLAIPCLVAGSTWGALLQAGGHVKMLAKIQSWSAFICLMLSMPLVYLLGSVGVAAGIFIVAAVPALLTWISVRRIYGIGLTPKSDEGRKELVELGGALVIVGFASQASAYAVRLLIIRQCGSEGSVSDGLAAAGYYHAALSIAASLPAIVYGALGTDFFPRVASAESEGEAKELSEQQIQASCLLGLPIFAGLITMSDAGIRFLYADRFEPAVPLLSWVIWGVYFRMMAAPLGYWLLARSKAKSMMIIEVTSSLIMVILPLVFMPYFGLLGSAVGYCLGSGVYAAALWVTCRYRAGSWINKRTVLIGFSGGFVLAISCVASAVWPGEYAGMLLTTCIAVACTGLYMRMLK